MWLVAVIYIYPHAFMFYWRRRKREIAKSWLLITDIDEVSTEGSHFFGCNAVLDHQEALPLPYSKLNHRPLYIHCRSSRPSNIIQNLPASISRCLTNISSDKTAFTEVNPLYDDALHESRYSEKTQYLEHRKVEERRRLRNRPLNITWYNPHFSNSVATNIGRRFCSLVIKHSQ